MTDLNDLPLSQTGQQRRERMLDDLLTHLRTHHRRRRIRRQAIIASPLLVLAKLASSNSEAIRKVKEGAVTLDGQKVTDFQKEYGPFDKPAVLKLGRKFARLVPT